MQWGQLVVELASDVNRRAAPDEIALIRAELPKAKFRNFSKSAASWDTQGYGTVGKQHPRSGRTIGPRDTLDSSEAHALKRVNIGHWKQSTTLSEFLEDIRWFAALETNQIHIGVDGITPKACFVATIPFDHGRKVLSPARGAKMLVFFDAVEEAIVTAFPVAQFYPLQHFRNWTNRRKLV